MKLFPCLYAGLFLSILIASTGCKDDRPAQEDDSFPREQQAEDEPGEERTNGNYEKADYANTDRVIWQKPNMVLNLLGNLENKTVADIGAGTGFFALRIAQEAKKVIAIDVDPRFTNYLDSIKTLELPEAYQDRLETRLAEPDNARLQPGEADIVMIVNTFMYIPNQTEYLIKLKEGISPGGKLLIIDFKRKRMPIGPPQQIRLPLYQVEDILENAGYKNIQSNDTSLDYQYIVTAEK